MSIPISQLTNGGLPNGNIEIPATNPLNTTQSINGTTFKYILADILQYILIAQGFTTYTSCRVATTAALTTTYANGVAGVGATLTNAGAQVALSIDGVTLALNDRVLIKNQINTFENGIYVVTNVGNLTTNWVLTRATDYNEPAEIVYLGVVAITQGTQNGSLVFQENSPGPFVIGTSPITFQQLQIDITLLPSASPANKILRSDGTYWVQSTNASLDASDKLYDLSELQVDNININGNSITSTDVGGDIVLTPNTVGSIVLDGLNWPQVDGTAGQVLYTDGAGQLGWISVGAPFTPAALTSTSDTNVTITLGGTPATALLQAASITMGWSGQLSISRGGTNTNILGSNGQLAQSDGTKYSWTTATYPSTATATGTILRADGTNWVATTATYPATTTINQILYSSANNVIGEITTANSATLVTSATGVPGFTGSMSNGQLVIGSTGATPVVGSITGAGSITVTPGAGTIQISSSAGGVVNPGLANEIAYYASSGSTVSGLTGANGSVLVTNNTGVPSMLANPAANYRPLMSQNAAIPVWSTAAYPNTATATGTIIRANGTDWAATTATYPNTTSINHILYSSAANVIGEIADAIGGVLVSNNTGVPSMLANPADNYRVLQSKNAAIPEWSVAAYPHTAGASGTLMQSDGTDWTNTQATYPGSTNKNHILYSSANNTVGEIATQKNAVLVSDNQSTPQWSGSLSDGQIIIGKTNDLPAAANLTAGTGISITNGNNSITITNTAPSTVTPAAMTRVDDTNVTLTLGGTPATSLLQAVSLTLGWSGQLAVSRGGTGASTVGASGTLAQSDGTKYTFTTATYPSTATSTGTMLRANGTNWLASTSTFADTYAASSLLYSNGANTVTGLATANSATLVTSSTGVPSWTSSMTNGQLLIGSTGATPVLANLTAGSGISISNGAGSITISGVGGGYSWTEVTGTTQTMVADGGYVANNPALVTLTLPTTAAFGTTISIAGKGAGGWKIAQNAGQEIFFGSSATTIGATGYLQSTQQFDSIELLCITANTQWTVITGPQGAITVA